MVTTYEMLGLLTDIFANTEAVDKIRIEQDQGTRTLYVRYEDLDDEWFSEMLKLRCDANRAAAEQPTQAGGED